MDKLLNPDFENQPNESSGLKTLNLVQLTQHLIDTLALKKTTLVSYEVVLWNLKGFEKKHKAVLTFKNADIDFYNSFVKYLSGLGLAQNTIGTRIKIVKAILNNTNERGLTVSMDYKKKSFSKNFCACTWSWSPRTFLQVPHLRCEPFPHILQKKFTPLHFNVR